MYVIATLSVISERIVGETYRIMASDFPQTANSFGRAGFDEMEKNSDDGNHSMLERMTKKGKYVC